MMKEKRKNNREKTLWKVNIVEEKNEEFIGYLMDLSEGGAKFYIDKKRASKLSSEFNIKISPPYEIELTNKIMKVEKVWERKSHFMEMGVRFCNPQKKDLEYIQKLLDRFNSDKKIHVETEIIP